MACSTLSITRSALACRSTFIITTVVACNYEGLRSLLLCCTAHAWSCPCAFRFLQIPKKNFFARFPPTSVQLRPSKFIQVLWIYTPLLLYEVDPVVHSDCSPTSTQFLLMSARWNGGFHKIPNVHHQKKKRESDPKSPDHNHYIITN